VPTSAPAVHGAAISAPDPNRGLVIVGVITFLVIGWQAWATARSVNIAARALEFTGRPWVKPDRIELAGPLVVDMNGARLKIKVSYTNVGQSVAQHVDPKATLLPLLVGHRLVDEVRNEVWERKAHWLNTTQRPNPGYALFPAQNAAIEIELFAPMAEMQNFWSRWMPAEAVLPIDQRRLPLLVAGRLFYSQAVPGDPNLSGPNRHSDFGYELTRIDPLPLLAKSCPMTELVLLTSPLGLHHAD
jgi:hypothetical protein